MIDFQGLARRASIDYNGDHPGDRFRNQMLDFIELRDRRGVQYKDERKPGYHVSGLTKMCARKLILRNLQNWEFGHFISADEVELRDDDIQPDYEHPAKEIQFEVGSAIHEAYQNHILGPSGVLFGYWHCSKCEAKLGPSLMPKFCHCGAHWRKHLTYEESKITIDLYGIDFHGNVDGLWLDPATGQLYVTEFKTISTSKYDKIKKPEWEHVLQVHGYMYALKLKRALIIYLDRGQPCHWDFTNGLKASGLRQKEYLVEFDQRIWDKLSKSVEEYAEVVRSMTKPEDMDDDYIDDWLDKAWDSTPACDVKSCKTAQACGVRNICFNITEV